MYLRDILDHSAAGGWGDEIPSADSQVVRVVRGADFPAVHLKDLSNCPVRFEQKRRLADRVCRPGDILLEISGGTADRPTGRSVLIVDEHLAASPEPLIPASFCRLLRVNPVKAVPRYVYFALQNFHAQGEAWEFQNRSTGLSNFQFPRFAAEWRLPAPPRSEQQAIAEVLGALDDKIAANSSLASKSAHLSQSIYDQVSRKAEDRVILSEVCETQYGVTASASPSPRSPRLVRVTDINKHPWITWGSVPGTSELSDADALKYSLSAGDIVIARMADPGKVAIIEEGDPSAVFASYLIRLRAQPTIPPLYMYHFLRSAEYQDYAVMASSGSVQKNMNAKVIVATSMPIVDSPEMSSFVQAVEPLHQALATALRESRTLAQLRDTLLPALMNGTLRVKDAISQAEEVL